jgi:nucleotide-binding universal stress UspA family protein
MKLQLKKILVPTDFSETSKLALNHASFLCRLIKADLLLVHVQSINPFYFEIPEPMMYAKYEDEMDKMVTDRLAEMSREIATEYGVTPKYMSRKGQVANEVMTFAQEENIDLIIMGTHGAKGFEELLLGSNAHKIVTLAPCPVITVQTHVKKTAFTKIVLPIDRSQHSREKVQVAIDMASIYASKIFILGLLEDPEEEEYNKLQIVLDQVQHAIQDAGLVCSRHTVKGDHLAKEALKFGESVNADLIIIMTEHESALTGIFMGPLAKQIVNHSRIPVMSIKPHYGSFESVDLTGGYSFY